MTRSLLIADLGVLVLAAMHLVTYSIARHTDSVKTFFAARSACLAGIMRMLRKLQLSDNNADKWRSD